MKPQLYIHIGFPKTGSTTLQRFFFSHKVALEKSGIFYPTPLAGAMPGAAQQGHCTLSEGASSIYRDIRPWTEYRKIYLDELLAANCRIHILSAETLPYDSPANLTCFRNDFQIKIICFFRNIFDFLVSGKRQVLKEGLRQDLFTYHRHRNFHILARIEEYINFFGFENCIFLNYDRIRKEGNLIDVFLRTIHADFHPGCHMENANVTPADAASMFLYQLSFLPFSLAEWRILRKELLCMDLSAWRDFRCTLLPPRVFELDDEARQAIGRQGELLRDPDWYDKTVERGRELAAIPNHDLPPEAQHDIFSRLSEEARAILGRRWPGAAQAGSAEPLLPSMEHLAREPFELLVGLHQGYVTSFKTAFHLQRQLMKDERSCMVATPTGAGAILAQLRACCASLFSASARQAYAVRQSGLFDIPWYLAHNADVARAAIDPVLHYVRYGAREGRDPDPWFSTRAYWRANPDVLRDGINPFYHYIRHGRAEGRKPA